MDTKLSTRLPMNWTRIVRVKFSTRQCLFHRCIPPFLALHLNCHPSTTQTPHSFVYCVVLSCFVFIPSFVDLWDYCYRSRPSHGTFRCRIPSATHLILESGGMEKSCEKHTFVITYKWTHLQKEQHTFQDCPDALRHSLFWGDVPGLSNCSGCWFYALSYVLPRPGKNHAPCVSLPQRVGVLTRG